MVEGGEEGMEWKWRGEGDQQIKAKKKERKFDINGEIVLT